MTNSALSEESYLLGDRQKITKFFEDHGIPKPMGYILRLLFCESLEVWEKTKRKMWISILTKDKTEEVLVKHFAPRSKDYHLALLDNNNERCNELQKEVEEIVKSYLPQQN